MTNKLESYNVKEWTVFGRNSFTPPFKVSDSLINEARIVYVVTGHSKMYSANQHMDLKSGDLLIMKTDNFINSWEENAKHEMNQVIVFQLNADFLRFLYDENLPDWFVKDDNTASLIKVQPNSIIVSFFQNLQEYLDQPNHLTQDIIQLKIKELISLIVQSDQTGDSKNIFGNLFNAPDYAFQEIIQKNLYEDLNIEDLAFFTGMSLSSFKRRFSAIFGTTPNKYIISKTTGESANITAKYRNEYF